MLSDSARASVVLPQMCSPGVLEFYLQLACEGPKLNSFVVMNRALYRPLPVSPSGVSGISACHFRTCWSLDQL